MQARPISLEGHRLPGQGKMPPLRYRAPMCNVLALLRKGALSAVLSPAPCDVGHLRASWRQRMFAPGFDRCSNCPPPKYSPGRVAPR
jgi:hypothetical protein